MWPVRAGAGPALPLTAGVIGRRLGVRARRGPARAGGGGTVGEPGGGTRGPRGDPHAAGGEGSPERCRWTRVRYSTWGPPWGLSRGPPRGAPPPTCGKLWGLGGSAPGVGVSPGPFPLASFPAPLSTPPTPCRLLRPCRRARRSRGRARVARLGAPRVSVCCARLWCVAPVASPPPLVLVPFVPRCCPWGVARGVPSNGGVCRQEPSPRRGGMPPKLFGGRPCSYPRSCG